MTWSAVKGGFDDTYATSIETFDSKKEAMEYARRHGAEYVVKGTQLWNKRAGRVEEGDGEGEVIFV